MKTIKNLIALVLFAFTLTTVSAQSVTTKDLLMNKWVIDKEAMKPVVAKMLTASPEYSALDSAGQEEALIQC